MEGEKREGQRKEEEKKRGTERKLLHGMCGNNIARYYRVTKNAPRASRTKRIDEFSATNSQRDIERVLATLRRVVVARDRRVKRGDEGEKGKDKESTPSSRCSNRVSVCGKRTVKRKLRTRDTRRTRTRTSEEHDTYADFGVKIAKRNRGDRGRR
jgi:hypothetical protein